MSTEIRDLLTSDAPAPERLLAPLDAARALLGDDHPEQAVPKPSLAGPVAAALIELLLERRDALRLVVLRERAQDKAVRKAAGKALYALKSRGVATPDLEATRVGALPLKREILPSYMTNADPTGLRFILYSASESNGPVVVHALVGDAGDTGLYSLHLFHEMSKTRLGKLLDSIREAESITVVEVDPGYARDAIHTAIERNVKAGRMLPEDTRAAQRYLDATTGPPAPTAHPARLALTDTERSSLREHLRRGDALAEIPETLGWGPGEEDLRGLLDKVSTLEASPIVISRSAAYDVARSLIDKEVVAFFDPDARARFADRLCDLAYLLQGTRRRELSLAALASADALLDTETPITEVPLAQRFFDRFFNLEMLVDYILDKHKKDDGPPDPEALGDAGAKLIVP